MVRDLHDAGIEVILDVVYNHTAEGNHMGPTLSMRGIDNAAYYRLVEDDERYYMDYTGTGNSLNVRNPHTLQLIMDSLRYWVTEMHVDGFRFDLASTLAREFYDVDRLSVFFDLVQQDPVISQVKLIAEPWDVGPGGYQVGNFPPLWSEWNGKYRDTVRDFWRGEPGTLGEFASRIDRQLRPLPGRRPPPLRVDQLRHRARRLHAATTSVSYNEKHNEANGEGGNDGESHNRSWNCGVEGPTDDAAVLALRDAPAAQLHHHADALPGRADDAARRRDGPHAERQQQRLLPGQRDRPGWTGRWPGRTPASSASPAGVVALRARPPGVPPPPVLRGPADRPRRAAPRAEPLVGLPDIAWFSPPAGDDRAGLGLRLRQVRHGVPQRPGDHRGRPRGERVTDDSFLLCLNAHYEDIEVTLPRRGVRRAVGDRRRHGGGRGDHALRRAGHRGGGPAGREGRRHPPVPARSVLVMQRLD